MPLTPEEQAELAALEQQRDTLMQEQAPAAEPSLLDKAGQMSESFGTGVQQGVRNVGQDLELGVRTLLDKAGLRPKDDIAKLKAAHQAQRIKSREGGARSQYPTTGEIGELVGDTATRLAGGTAAVGTKAASVVGQIAQGAGLGAIIGASRTPQNDESRIGNALTEAGLFGGFSAVGQLGRLRPQIDQAAAAAFNKLGINPSLSQVVKSPFVRDAAQTMEKLLEQLPGVGTKIARRRQYRIAEKALTKIGEEFDNSLAFGALIKKSAKDAADLAKRIPSKENIFKAEKAAEALDRFQADDVIRNAYQAATKGKGVPDLNVFNSQLSTHKKKLLGLKYKPPETQEQIKAIQKVGKILNRLPKPTPGPSGIGVLGIGGGAVAGTIAGIPAGPALAMGAAVKGLSLMLTSKAGVNLITKTPTPEVLKVAVKLGVASAQKDALPDINNMSLEELEALKKEMEKQ